jgi:hypothetical protein
LALSAPNPQEDRQMTTLLDKKGELDHMNARKIGVTSAVVGALSFVSGAAGFWVASASAERPVVALSAGPTSSISPLEMHLKANPADIPVQYMRGDSYY